MNKRKTVIGLALGSGSARGWSHIGVLRALEKRGIVPDIVCGTSIGSIVAAAYASDQLDDLEAWVRTLEWRDILNFMDLNFGGKGGLFTGKKLFDYMRERFGEWDIEKLPRPFGAIAADMDNGLEVWMRDGTLLSAVRASISLPGIFTPVLRDDRWLVDGGLVNPVPVSLCRAMGADFVIAVDLNSDLLGGGFSLPTGKEDEEKSNVESLKVGKSKIEQLGIEGQKAESLKGEKPRTENEEKAGSDEKEDKPSFWTATRERITSGFWGNDLKDSLAQEQDERPSMIEVISKSVNIMQVRITRSRMAGEPPDILIQPKLGYLGLMEFHRAAEAIEEGHASVERIASMLEG